MNALKQISWQMLCRILFILYNLFNIVGTQSSDCPNFEYISVNGVTAGEITVPSLELNRVNRLEVRFSQRGVQPQSAVGGLMPYPDEVSARNLIGTNRPISYRITLARSRGLLPKLTLLTLNGIMLCSSSEYGRPNSYFNRYFEMYHYNTVQHSGPNIYNDVNSNDFGADTNYLNQNDYTLDQELDVRSIPTNNNSNRNINRNINRFVPTPEWQTPTATYNDRINTNRFVPQPQWQTPTRTFNERRFPQVQPTTAVAVNNQRLPGGWPPVQPEQDFSTPAQMISQQTQQTTFNAVPPTPRRQMTTLSTTTTTQRPRLTPTVARTATNTRLTEPFNPTLRLPSVSNTDYSCGIERTPSTLAPFIVMGKRYDRGRHPWLAAVFHKVSIGRLDFKCGGSLISGRMVITAAHCTFNDNNKPARMVVSLGRYNLEEYGESETFEILTVDLHPQYDMEAYPDADVALLTLKQTVSFSQYIIPICVWSETDTIPAMEGETGYVAGWGSDENGSETTVFPKEVSARIVDERTCVQSPGYRALITGRTVCAGNLDGSGPCMGDSGGGLMINRNGRWILRGTVSVGPRKDKKCDLNKYVIYCDLSKHLNWLHERIQ